jgi:hypothetical protein
MPKREISLWEFEFLKILSEGHPSRTLHVSDPDLGDGYIAPFLYQELKAELQSRFSVSADEVSSIAAKAVRQGYVKTAIDPVGCVPSLFGRKSRSYWYLTPRGGEAVNNPISLARPLSKDSLDTRYEPKGMWLRRAQGPRELPKYLSGLATCDPYAVDSAWIDYRDGLQEARRDFSVHLRHISLDESYSSEETGILLGSFSRLVCCFLVVTLIPQHFHINLRDDPDYYTGFIQEDSIASLFGLITGMTEALLDNVYITPKDGREVDLISTRDRVVSGIAAEFYNTVFGPRFQQHHVDSKVNVRSGVALDALELGKQWYLSGNLLKSGREARASVGDWFLPVKIG